MKTTISWTNYADVYDFMAKANQAYQELLSLFEKRISNLSINGENAILEIGSGTGNFTVLLHQHFPHSKIICVEPDENMLKKAKDKFSPSENKNVEFQLTTAEEYSVPLNSVSVCVMMHSLYTFQKPQETLRKVFQQLQPGGYLIVCDPGRIMKVRDWSVYLFKTLSKRHGVFKTLYFFYKARNVASINRQISQCQKEGRYWVHSHEAFCQTIEMVGFTILDKLVTYRGYSDFVVAMKSDSCEQV
jgi:ubiquinone/menaquinone biosynthesis C-methylase UbiE